MTKEELALKHIRKVKGLTSQWSDKEIKIEYEDYFDGYLAGAEPREKRIAELEAQIEKMKCCYNCSKWNDGECEESPKSKTFFCADFKCNNWEMFK